MVCLVEVSRKTEKSCLLYNRIQNQYPKLLPKTFFSASKKKNNKVSGSQANTEKAKGKTKVKAKLSSQKTTENIG